MTPRLDGWQRGPTVFTHEAVAIMRRMAAAGSTAPEIAKAIGAKPSSVSVMCNRYQIKLGMTRHVGASVSLQTRQALIQEAKRRGHQGVGPLIRRILATVAKDKLFDAVLGEPRN
jgi:DNA-binding NarL/FixJ family response regulator